MQVLDVTAFYNKQKTASFRSLSVLFPFSDLVRFYLFYALPLTVPIN